MTPPSTATAPVAPLYSDRDRQRGYVINVKLLVLAYLTEAVIATASLVGAAVFARTYGHGDHWLMVMMMLAPLAYAAVDISRVPLALAARTQPSIWLRLLSVIGVLCAASVTVKSMSQLGEIMFRPRLMDVMHARQHLDDARTVVANLELKITEADRLIGQRSGELQSAESQLALATDKLGGLPEQKCLQTAATTLDGRTFKGVKCVADPRIPALTSSLAYARTQRDAAVERLAAARTDRAPFDRSVSDRQLSAMLSDYREAVLNSQLHSFTAMAFGKDPSEVTDGELHRFLRLFVFLPAICAALAATLVAMASVTWIKPDETIMVDEAAADYILAPLAQQIIRDATEATLSAMRASVTQLNPVLVPAKEWEIRS